MCLHRRPYKPPLHRPYSAPTAPLAPLQKTEECPSPSLPGPSDVCTRWRRRSLLVGDGTRIRLGVLCTRTGPAVAARRPSPHAFCIGGIADPAGERRSTEPPCHRGAPDGMHELGVDTAHPAIQSSDYNNDISSPAMHRCIPGSVPSEINDHSSCCMGAPPPPPMQCWPSASGPMGDRFTGAK